MKRRRKQILALCMAAAVSSSMFSGMGVVQAAEESDEVQADGETGSYYEPWAHGYRFVDILNWNPDYDDYSDEMRASVPLQERNETFAATQANPDLSTDVKIYAISSGNYRSTDTAEAPWNANMSYDDFSYNAFKMWQYVDYVGAGGRPTSGISIGAADKEYGVLALPQAAAVNAAHKNGVLALGEYFIPRTPQYTEEWLYKDADGNFPYAQKLVDMMNYYGFDGYFINQEASIDASYVPLFREMLTWMRAQGCYIQWYDSILDNGRVSYQNLFNTRNSNWVWNEENGRVSDSIFLNYWNTNNREGLLESADYAESLGLNPRDAIFYGVEGGQWRFGPDLNLDRIVDDDGEVAMSIAIWGSDFYREQYNKAGNNRYKSGYQWASEERERLYYTGLTEDAQDHSTQVDRTDVEVEEGSTWKGFASYTAEKSVINGSVFTSDFNNGHGMQYWENGEVSRDMEWTNDNLQDILPTWQWWVTSTDENKLDLDWDYGEKLTKIMSDGSEGDFGYQQIGAYNGGSSLVMWGDVKESQDIHLYKTDLDVKADSKLTLTYNKISTDDSSKLQLSLVFKDNPENTVLLPVDMTGEKTDGWQTKEVSLADYAGRELASIGVEVSADTLVSDYQLNLGGLSITDGTSYTPAAPQNLAISKNLEATGEVQISWDKETYDKVQLYRVYAAYEDGSERFAGGVYGDNYYIQTLENADDVTSLKLYAVGKDGSVSEAASVDYSTANAIHDIQAVSKANELTVSWDETAENYQKVEVSLDYWYSEKENPETITVNKGDKKAVFAINQEDGEKYILTLTTVNADGTKNTSVNYYGELCDTFCEPYAGSARKDQNGNLNLTVPEPEDWKTAYVDANGKRTTYQRFGGDSMKGIRLGAGLQSMVVTLVDMDGNTSTPTTMYFIDGEPVDLDSEFDENVFPDEILQQAVQEQVGTTYRDLSDYSGALDLSGLEISDMTGLGQLIQVSELDLSKSNIEVLKAGILPMNLQTLDLSDCESLTSIEQDVVAGMTSLTELNLSGCTGLQQVYLNNTPAELNVDMTYCTSVEELKLTGTKMKNFDISGLDKLAILMANDSELETLETAETYENAYLFDLSGSKFDLSDGTPERTFADAMDDYIKDNPQEKRYGELRNLGTKATVLEGATIQRIDSILQGGGYNTTVGEAILDLGEELPIKNWTLRNDYVGYNYGVKAMKMEYSSDKEQWYAFGDAVTDVNESAEGTLDQEKMARYIRITFSEFLAERAVFYGSLSINGREAASMGVNYEGQKPVIYYGEKTEELTKLQNAQEIIRLKDYFEPYYKDAVTVRDTKIADMDDVSWVDENYDIVGGAAIPAKTAVEIYDEDGNMINAIEDTSEKVDIETNVALNAQILGGSGQNTGEEYDKLFDGEIAGSKWCTGAGSGYMAFALDEAETVGRWVTTHAGEGEGAADFNTADFELQVLNTEAVGMSEEDFLAGDYASDLSDDANWTTLRRVRNNFDNISDITLEDTTKARVYRLKVNKAQQGANYIAIRIYEMALYREDQTPRDYDGNLKLDQLGQYTVNFVKAGTNLHTMTVNVVERMSDDTELTKLITDTEGIKLSLYTDATAEKVSKELENSKVIVADKMASKEEIEAAKNALTLAVEGLELKLTGLIKQAESLDMNRYTAATAEALRQALEEAKQAAVKPVDETKVEAADSKLRAAMNNLVLKPVSSDENTEEQQNQITKEIADAIAGNKEAVQITLPKNTVLTKANMETIKNSGKKLEIKADHITWKFDSIDNAIEFNPEVTIGANVEGMDTALKNAKVSDTAKLAVVSFAFDGTLPGKATVTLDLSTYGFAENEKVYLYYLNKSNNTLELVDDSVCIGGKTEFEITHCSDYVVLNEKLAAVAPNTGDTNAAASWLLALGTGMLLLCVWRKKNQKI